MKESVVDRWIKFRSELEELELRKKRVEDFYKKNDCSVPYVDIDNIDNTK